jgi:hypothetical protein
LPWVEGSSVSKTGGKRRLLVLTPFSCLMQPKKRSEEQGNLSNMPQKLKEVPTSGRTLCIFRNFSFYGSGRSFAFFQITFVFGSGGLCVVSKFLVFG